MIRDTIPEGFFKASIKAESTGESNLTKRLCFFEATTQSREAYQITGRPFELNETEPVNEAQSAALRPLNGRKLTSEVTILVDITRTSPIGTQFALWLFKQPGGILSKTPAFSGTRSEAREAPPLSSLRGDYFENVPFPSETISLSYEGLDFPLFRSLGELVSPGGSFTVSYSHKPNESGGVKEETRKAIERGYPIVVTPLGYLLFVAGCAISFTHRRSAGRRDGSGELQGFKPLDAQEEVRYGKSLTRKLHQFMATQTGNDDLARTCRFKAFAVIEKIQNSSPVTLT